MPPGPPLDFDTGKLRELAQQLRGHRRYEYLVLGCLVALTSCPVLAGIYLFPLPSLCLLLFAGYFQTLLTFATSTSTHTSHHIRFLLAGNNPIGMTGGSALLFGAVDAFIDWHEDRHERRRRPHIYWPLLMYKLAMTPVGTVLMVMEYGWDLLLLRRPGLIRLKHTELFSLAWYHDLICPEKSNDLFYADLAFARFRNDVHLYQWNRLRAMVFELEHYRQDHQRLQGVPTSNLFWQDDITAYQSLKRLQLETIEAKVTAHFQQHPDMLPVPGSIAERLVQNARPLSQYLRMRNEALNPNSVSPPAWETDFRTLCVPDPAYTPWHVLRVLDTRGEVDSATSAYLSPSVLQAMCKNGILAHAKGLHSYSLTPAFQTALQALLNEAFTVVEPGSLQISSRLRLPTYLTWNGVHYAPNTAPTATQSKRIP